MKLWHGIVLGVIFFFLGYQIAGALGIPLDARSLAFSGLLTLLVAAVLLMRLARRPASRPVPGAAAAAALDAGTPCGETSVLSAVPWCCLLYSTTTAEAVPRPMACCRYSFYPWPCWGPSARN